VALRYDGQEVTLAEFESEFARRGPQSLGASERDSVLLAFASGLLDKLVMAREATEHVRGDTSGMARIVESKRRERILELVKAREAAKIDLSDERMDRIYEFLGEEVRARHILCQNPDEAREIREALAGGADFAELARTRSRDAFSAPDGGELGWFAYGEYEGIDDAAFELEVGQYSEPVYTRRGWHIVQLEERRPRARDVVETHPGLYARHFPDRLINRRWEEYLGQLWYERGAEFDEAGFELALALQADYRDRYAATVRMAQAVQDTGGTLAPSFYEDFPRGPEPSPEQRRVQLAHAKDGFAFRVGEAADLMWLEPMANRPSPTDPRAYRDWVAAKVREALAIFEAARTGYLEEPDVARKVRDAVEYAYVERLYADEVHRKTNPDEDDLRSFFEEFQHHYRWRPRLDLAVFRTSDNATAHQIAAALAAGDPVEAIAARFSGDKSLEVVPRTGLQRDFEGEDFNEAVRALQDSVGMTTGPMQVDGKETIARIEDRGEPEQMTFDEAREFLLPNCSAYLREKRTRAFLDSLRQVMDAEINREVVLRAKVGSAG
jgi:parvulin-like peptidyl-prolyl isomerase